MQPVGSAAVAMARVRSGISFGLDALNEARASRRMPLSGCLRAATILVTGLLEAGVRSVTKSGKACLISSGMIMCHPDNQAVAETLAKRRAAFRQAISEQLLRWLPEPDAHSFARYLVTVLQGLSVQARDGATMEDLRPVIELALSAASLCESREGSVIGR